jgi:hypothetical protein
MLTICAMFSIFGVQISDHFLTLFVSTTSGIMTRSVHVELQLRAGHHQKLPDILDQMRDCRQQP